MEFPDLGQHCSESSCCKLDFLPLNCDGCGKVFCSTHFPYEMHHCSSNLIRDHQVPMCPLCGELVPTAPGVTPDRSVSQHIDRQCKSESLKIFTNRCSFEKCKKKEMVPFNCSQCRQNFCLRHRHTADHKCEGPKATAKKEQEQLRITAMNAIKQRMQKGINSIPAMLQEQNTKRDTTAPSRLAANLSQIHSLQGDMTDDEALARAIAQSIIDSDEKNQATKKPTLKNSTPQTIPVGGESDSSGGNQKDKCKLS